MIALPSHSTYLYSCRKAFRPAQRALVLLTLAATSATAADKKSAVPDGPPAVGDPVLMQAMETELHRAMAELGSVDGTVPGSQKRDPGHPSSLKPYYIGYSVADAETVSISAQYGAIVSSTQRHSRTADVQVRLGTARRSTTRMTRTARAR